MAGIELGGLTRLSFVKSRCFHGDFDIYLPTELLLSPFLWSEMIEGVIPTL